MYPRDNNKISSELHVGLEELIAIDELQEVQDSFSEVANVAIRTIDHNGRALTSMSHPPTLCSDAFKDSILRKKLYTQCLPAFLGGEGIIDEDLSFEYIPGFKNYLVPLKIKFSKTRSLILGYMVIGPVVFMKRKERQEYKEDADKHEIDLDELWSLALELRVFSYRGIRSLLDMLDNTMGRILNLAYDKAAMQKKMFSGSTDKGIKKLELRLNQANEFAEIFLDLAMDITRGSTGSVMLWNHEKRAFEIKAAHGLSDAIVRSTSVKLGEGVCGLAAEMKRPFLISNDSVDQILAERLSKPDLVSSVVVPIKCRDSVYGVINISSDRDCAVKFNEATLTLLSRAAGLAGVAFENIQN
jgi:ligand-binding sensor protein